jgi:hypothetical protein
MDIRTVMKRLAESGINCALYSYLDGGWTVRIGPMKGFMAEGNFRTLDEAAAFLDRLARKQWPESAYATEILKYGAAGG